MAKVNLLLPSLVALAIGMMVEWEVEAAPPECKVKEIKNNDITFTIHGNTNGAKDTGLYCDIAGFEGGRDVSYSWVVPESGLYQIDTIGSQFDTVLTILDGVCPGDFITCDDDSGGGNNNSLVQVDLVEGEEITIIVDGFSAGAKGKFNLNVNLL